MAEATTQSKEVLFINVYILKCLDSRLQKDQLNNF